MVVGSSQQETLDPGFVILDTRQQGVPVILRELVLLDGLDVLAIYQTSSPESNPDSPLPVILMVGKPPINKLIGQTYERSVANPVKLSRVITECNRHSRRLIRLVKL
ncbi:unnamed protein product [Schistosoma curassoni]|uniref:DUF4192 family protein n=1 Tax=Schistosoma curassoni TaxID=6186 RepID=A0A183JXF0_9TREM|nr:unnamed protein product [Schistosoma curassoni]